jgi:hypothetical protein
LSRIKDDELAKSQKTRHCEQSEAISWITTACNYWIPAFAGMTIKGYVGLFTIPSKIINKKTKHLRDKYD